MAKPKKTNTGQKTASLPAAPAATPQAISDIMKKAYLDYAMSVIVSRALPDVRDGLKPVQRRIIYAMHEMGAGPGAKFVKCAAVVGDTMKKYHPHMGGLYEALVRMGQSFSLRSPLIQPQGNFGSIDGDPPAAMRYTECRLEKISAGLLQDIDKETVDFIHNYSADYYEPLVLPTILPNLLLNGSVGIAVGMATNIPPHNLREVIDGLLLTIKQGKPVEIGGEAIKLTTTSFITENLSPSTWYRFTSKVTPEKLIETIPGPDFPTGGVIYDRTEIIRAYTTGKGRVVTRGVTTITKESEKNGKAAIIITELPYQVNKALLVSKIAALHESKKVTGIAELRDESAREGLRIYIGLKKGTNPQRILKQLHKHTDLQTIFHVNMVGLIRNEPKTLTLKTILEEFISHRQEVIVRRTIFLLRKALEREHILQGLKIALDSLDEVIETIKKSQDTPTANANLVKKFKLTEIQAQAILDMPLKRLSALERQKIEDELGEITTRVGEYRLILATPEKVIEIITTELNQVKEAYGEPRRTKVIKGGIGEIADEELIKEEEVLVTITDSGYIKRLSIDTYKTQARGGKGVAGAQLQEGDEVCELHSANTHDQVLFFSDRGKVYSLRAWDIPASSRRAKGTALINLIAIKTDERITAMLTLPKAMKIGGKYFTMGTEQGMVKRTAISEFAHIRQSGITAIRLRAGDKLAWVKQTDGRGNIIFVTAQGKSIRFAEKGARPMGRPAGGVRGIKLGEGDQVIEMDVIAPDPDTKGYLLVVSQNGVGKRTRLSYYRRQKRGGSGVLTAKITTKTGPLVGARVIDATIKDVLLTSVAGQVIRLPLKDVSILGRATQGVRLMRLGKEDEVAAVACL